MPEIRMRFTSVRSCFVANEAGSNSYLLEKFIGVVRLTKI